MSHDIDERVEDALARLDAQVARARASRESLTAELTELRNIEATARSPRGECSVTARADGTVVDVRLGPRADPGPALEKLLTATVVSAQREARQNAADQAEVLLGHGAPWVRDIRLQSPERG
ncbi:YbaB/EbfC family nucleoid-associated protein [uncultured Microbacterium sp.]|uniref:YbaB/EbfC family nucleoid-associated protein n=1 Tax=uncultured Microbacterium sp. TaxID=191216 RepID=UPI0034598A01